MKKILLSIGMIALVGAIVAGATGAFFSDTETSSGNTFTAGAIDLKIDNESYVTDVNGDLVASPSTSWTLSDLTNQLFFDFNDIKPGDIGEDTISVHVTSNDAWACMAIKLTKDADNDCTEPESLDDASCNIGDSLSNENGELDSTLHFAFWADDGDNVYEEGEQIFKRGTAEDIFDGNEWAIADSNVNVWATTTGSSPLVGERTYFIAKAWCAGALTDNAVVQDGFGKIVDSTNGPLERGTGFTCDGRDVNNESQTDSIMADVSFRAVQSRNNGLFVCDASIVPNP